MFGRAKKPGIPASQLAAFAEDPKRFANAQGRAYNAKAAQYGTNYHNNMGRTSRWKSFAIFIVLLLLLGSLAGLLSSF